MTRPRSAREPKTYSLEISPSDFRIRIFDGSQYVAVYEPHERELAVKELTRLTKPRTRKAAAPAAPAAVEAAHALELAAPVPVVARAAPESLFGAVTAAPSPYASAAQAPRPAAQFGRAEDFRTPHIKEFGQYGTESHGYKVWNPLAASGQGAYVGKDLYTPFANLAEASNYLVEVRQRMQEAGQRLSARDRRHVEKDRAARATVGMFFAKSQPEAVVSGAPAAAAKQRTLFNGPRRTFPNAAQGAVRRFEIVSPGVGRVAEYDAHDAPRALQEYFEDETRLGRTLSAADRAHYKARPVLAWEQQIVDDEARGVPIAAPQVPTWRIYDVSTTSGRHVGTYRALDPEGAILDHYDHVTERGRRVPAGFALANFRATPRTHANPPLSHFLPPPRGFDASEHRSRERDREGRDRDVRDPDARRVPPPYAALPNPSRRPRRRRARRTR